MNSTRLPGKVLKPLSGAPMLQRLIERTQGAKHLDALVVATTLQDVDRPIVALCDRLGVRCHRGSETDVLGRMLAAGENEGAGAIVRLTGDNPFVSRSLVDLVAGTFLAAVPDADYAQNADESGFPFGLFVEVCGIGALRASAQSADPAVHEHVTWYVRTRPDLFRHVRVTTSAAYAEKRLSIDTAEDYARLKPLFEALYAADPDFDYRALEARDSARC